MFSLRKYFADISYAPPVSIAVAIGLIATISPTSAYAEFFVPTGLGGNLSYGYSYVRFETSASDQSTITLGLNGSGYFWQPWFLGMGAGIGLGLSQADSNARSDSGSTGKSVSGSVDFTLFPQSRFPTNFGYTQYDSRQEVKDNILLSGQHSQTRRFYIRQTYNTLGGTNINAWFDQNAGSVSNQPGESIDRSLGFQVRKRVPYHDFGFGGGYFENEPAQSDAKNSNSNLLLSHSYAPSGGEVGISSAASYSQSATSGSGGSQFSSAYKQISSSMSWRPEHRPYYISGGALVYSVLSGGKSQGVSTNANASYVLAHNVTVSGGVSASVTDVNGTQSFASGQSIGTGLSSEPYVFFGFNYGWNFGIGLASNISRTDTSTTDTSTGSSANTSGTNTKKQLSMSLSLSQSLGRSVNLGPSASMNLSFGQSASVGESVSRDTDSRSRSHSRSLSHSASWAWNHSGFGGSTTAGASLSDSRSFGQSTSAFQVFSANLARTQEVSRLSSLAGFLSFQASHANDANSGAISNGNGGGSEDTIPKSASAGFSYTHSRFFGVHGLNFSSRLSIPTLLKNDNTHSTSAKDWDNVWAYHIGLLSLNWSARVSDAGTGQRVYSMNFQAVRNF